MTPDVSVGDKVLLESIHVKVEGEEVLVMREDDIMGVIEVEGGKGFPLTDTHNFLKEQNNVS